MYRLEGKESRSGETNYDCLLQNDEGLNWGVEERK